MDWRIKMKRISKILIAVLLLSIAVLAFGACNNANATLSVKENGMPQLVHVLGEELDFSNGVLVYDDGKEKQEIAMNAEGVELSGYDKTKLGEQTVTVKYNGKETTVNVTVVPRMTVEGETTEYLVGDSFDTANGTLKITRNDGTTFTVILKSDKVKIEGFDSSKEGALNLKAKYTSGSTVYECDFTANVNKIESVTMTSPTKLVYNSHDGALDVTGGEFVLVGGNGTIKRNVALKVEDVLGFDISAVTPENTPYTQKLTVKYDDNKSFEYEVKLVYTDISLFKDNAKGFTEINWEGEEEPTFEAAEGDLALELIAKYLDMSPSERRFITAKETLSVARAAMSYGFNVWAEEVLKYNDAFAVEYGEFVFKCESREAIESAILGLNDKTSPLYTVSPILIDMMHEFTEETVYEFMFGEYPVLNSDIYPDLIDIFEYMLDLDDVFDLVPETWKADGVETYATQIETVYNTIINSQFLDSEFSQIFIFVSSWRTEDDAFDFLYTYYYGIENIEALVNLSTVRLPSALEEVYLYTMIAMEEMEMISQNVSFDASYFLYNYYKAITLADALRTHEDEMTRVFYNELPINGIMGMDFSSIFLMDDLIDYITTAEGGYYSRAAALIGIPEYETLMDSFLKIVVRTFDEEGYEGGEEYHSDIADLLVMYLALTPAEQINFLSIFNVFYGMGIPPIAFDPTEEFADFTCVFVQMIYEHFDTVFTTETGKLVFRHLVSATELYSQRYTNNDWLAEFNTRMESLKEKVSTLEGAELAAYETYLAAEYQRLLSIYTELNSTEEAPELDLGDWEAKFNELAETVLTIELAYQLLENNVPMYSLFFSAYERAAQIVDYILEFAPAEIKEAYYSEDLYCINELGSALGGEELPEEEKIYWSFEYVMSLYRSIYINAQINFNGESIYDYYNNSSMAKFMSDAYDVIWKYLMTDAEAETIGFDKAAVLRAMKSFRELDVTAQTLFVLMEGDNGYYYIALDAFINENCTEAAGALVFKILELEQAMILYNNFLDAESLAEVERLLGEASDLYEALVGDDKTSFADFEDEYKFYLDAATKAIEDAKSAEEETPAA